jgi:hypothetical protein
MLVDLLSLRLRTVFARHALKCLDSLSSPSLCFTHVDCARAPRMHIDTHSSDYIQEYMLLISYHERGLHTGLGARY